MELQKAQEILASSNQVEGWKITIKRPAKVRMKYRGQGIVKVSTIPARIVNYGNKAAIKEGHESGAIEKRPNNWTKISKGIYRDDKGKVKLCLDLSALQNQKSKTQWFMGDLEVTKEEIAERLLASETSKKPKPQWLTLNLETVESIKIPGSK